MRIVFSKKEGYQVFVDDNDVINLEVIDSELNGADFCLVSSFDGSVIKTAEEIRSEIMDDRDDLEYARRCYDNQRFERIIYKRSLGKLSLSGHFR